jgi:integrase
VAHIQDRGKSVERRWQARYRDPDDKTKEITHTFRRKIDAQRWLDEETADIVTGRYVDPRAGRVTLRAFADDWLESQTFDVSTREGTERRLRLHVLPTLGGLELRALKPSTVQAWLRGTEKAGCAPSSIRIMLVNLSAILTAAVEDGLIASNPCSSSAVKAPAVERQRVVPWTVEQVAAVIDAHPEPYRAIPVIAAGCGLRQGECFGVQVGDVDFLGRRVLVRRQVKVIDGAPVLAAPKSKRDREVPLPDVVAVALAEHLRVHPADGGQVFTWRDGGLINRAHYNPVWRRAVAVAGFEPGRDTGMHQLRHHYASVLLDGGVSIRALADYLGHADPGFTLRVYSHLMPDSESRARAVIDAAYGAPAESVRNGLVVEA